jgi:hypothetical protein
MAGRRWSLRSAAVSADNVKRLERRVARAADEALADHGFVSSIDVLCGLGWLHPSNVERWRRGQPACLEDVVFIEPARIATAIRVLQTWARERGLEPSECPHAAGSRAPRELRFSAAGDLELERAYRTHWLSLEVSEAQRVGLTEREVRRSDLVVIEALKDFTCAVCGAGCAGLLVMEDPGPVCMACADLDHLVFLASGDAALTRRARAASGLSAIAWCALAVRASATSARGFSSRSRRSSAPRPRAWPTIRPELAVASATGCGEPSTTSSSRSGWRRRSSGCSRAARASGRSRSPATPPRVAAGGSGAPPPAARWSLASSSLPSEPPFGTATPATTSC